MRLPILPGTASEAAAYAALRYDLDEAVGAVVRCHPLRGVVMQATLDDYQAGQNATDTATASIISTDGHRRAALDGRRGGASTTALTDCTLANFEVDGSWLAGAGPDIDGQASSPIASSAAIPQPPLHDTIGTAPG